MVSVVGRRLLTLHGTLGDTFPGTARRLHNMLRINNKHTVCYTLAIDNGVLCVLITL